VLTDALYLRRYSIYHVTRASGLPFITVTHLSAKVLKGFLSFCDYSQ